MQISFQAEPQEDARIAIFLPLESFLLTSFWQPY